MAALEYYRDISAEDIRVVYIVAAVFSTIVLAADLGFIAWGFNAYTEVSEGSESCGNEFSIASGTYTADFSYDVKYLLAALFCQTIPFFVTIVMVIIKFLTDCIRGRPWKCLDESLGISFTTLLAISCVLTFAFVTQVMSQYLQSSSSCLTLNEAAYPIASDFIIGSFIFLYVILFLTAGGLIGLTTTFCCWRYCCCAYTPAPYPQPYERREGAPLLPR